MEKEWRLPPRSSQSVRKQITFDPGLNRRDQPLATSNAYDPDGRPSCRLDRRFSTKVQGVPAKCGEGTVLDSESVRAITCPSCGAQIHVAEGQNRTTCAYCGVELQLPHPSRPEAKLTIVVPSSNVRPKPIEAAPKRWGSSVVVLVVVLLAAAGLVTFGVLQGLGHIDVSSITSALSSLRASTPALLVPGAAGGNPDVLVYTVDHSKDSRFLTYLDGQALTTRWESPALGEDSYRAEMAESDALIYVGVNTGVMALDRQTGQVSWQASVSDELPYGCGQGCLRVVGQRVVVLAKDGGLYGLDAQSGRVVWNTRLNSTPDQLFAANDRVAVFDKREGDVVLSIIDPVDGTELHALSPKCTDSSSGFTDDPDLSSSVLVSPDQKSLILLFGFFSSCVQRWDVASGSMMWSASHGDVSFSNAFDPSPIIIGDSLFVSSDNQLVEVKLADGQWRVLIEDPDYEFVPLAEQDAVLITRAKRTRGTTRFELWGVDADTGKRIWQHPLPGSEPLDEPDRMIGLIDQGELAWTAHLTPEGLSLVQAEANPHQLTVETLDPATGASAGVVAMALNGISGDFYSVPEIIGWNGDQLWLMVEGRLDVVNLALSQIDLVWP